MSTFYADYPVSGGGGVSSLNGETGDLTLVAGAGISITEPTATTIQIASTSSGDVTIGAFSASPSVKGLTINGSQVLNMDPADATHPGGVSILAQAFAGYKNFTESLKTPYLYNPSDVIIIDTANATLNDWSGNPFAVGSNHTLSNGGTTLIDCSGGMAQFNRGFRFLSNDGSNNVDFSINDGGGTNYGLIWPPLQGGVSTILQNDGSGNLSWASRPAGTVTSVAMTVPAFLSVSGSPVTSSGTLAVSLSGTALPVANGGTGVTSLSNFTAAGTDGIVVTGGTGAVVASTSVAQHVADSTHNGYLSSTDWSTFNGKQASGNYITALTGDATASGPGSAALTLATVNSNVGSFGSSTSIPTFTVNGKGLITAASGNAVIAPAGTLTGTTLASNVVTSSLTSVGTITSGTWTGTTIAVANGGTGQTSYTNGQLLIGNTSGNTLAKATITAGTGISVTNGAGSITIANTGVASLTAPKITTYASGGASGTHTFTGSPLYVRVRMVGAGGGGSGSGTAAGTAAGDGTASTFGTSLLSAGGGIKGVFGGGSGGAGGTSSLGTGPTGTLISGTQGQGATFTAVTTVQTDGGMGGGSMFGPGVPGGGAGNAAPGASTNGQGGGGGGQNGLVNNSGGVGGGGGGGLDAIISGSTLSGLSGSAAYAVGTSGTAGGAGTGGLAGGAGGGGYIEITEYYQ